MPLAGLWLMLKKGIVLSFENVWEQGNQWRTGVQRIEKAEKRTGIRQSWNRPGFIGGIRLFVYKACSEEHMTMRDGSAVQRLYAKILSLKDAENTEDVIKRDR